MKFRSELARLLEKLAEDLREKELFYDVANDLRDVLADLDDLIESEEC